MCRAYGAWGSSYITDPLLAEWANFCRASGADIKISEQHPRNKIQKSRPRKFHRDTDSAQDALRASRRAGATEAKRDPSTAVPSYLRAGGMTGATTGRSALIFIKRRRRDRS